MWQRNINLLKPQEGTCRPRSAAGSASGSSWRAASARAASRYLAPSRPPWRASHAEPAASAASAASAAVRLAPGSGRSDAPSACAAVSRTGATTCRGLRTAQGGMQVNTRHAVPKASAASAGAAAGAALCRCVAVSRASVTTGWQQVPACQAADPSGVQGDALERARLQLR